MKFFSSKRNIALLISLSGGLLLSLIYLLFYQKSENEITGSTRMIGYSASFIVFVTLYISFVAAKRTILANIILIATLILCVELFCFFKLDMPSANKEIYPTPPSLPDDHIANNIGSVPFADSVYHSVLVKNNDTVFDIHATIDSNCKRFTPNHSDERDMHALFFGCSITYGEGVEDNETMPYCFQEMSGYNSYNFGLSGHSTNHMLARIQYKPLTLQVKEKKGVAFYIFFWDHIHRSIGSMDRYCSWLHNAPYYYIDDNKLKRDKMFYNGRKWISKFYECAYQTNIVKKFGIDFPPKISETHLNLVAEMIRESKSEYLKQFPGNEFYCVIYPDWANTDKSMIDDFKNKIKEKDIKLVDLTWFEYKAEHSLGGDPHPSPATHAQISQIIFNEIASQNQ